MMDAFEMSTSVYALVADHFLARMFCIDIIPHWTWSGICNLSQECHF